MNYIIEYDISAFIILLTIIIHTLFNPQFPNKKNSCFSAILIVSTIAIVTDLSSTWTIENADEVPLALNSFVNNTYYLSQAVLPMLMFFFMLSMGRLLQTLSQRNYILSLIPFCVTSLFILTNPWTKLIFYFDSDLVYTYGPMQKSVYANMAFYMFMVVFISLKHRRHYTRRDRNSMILFLSIQAGALFVQFIKNELLVIGLGMAISVLVMYLTMQNPAEMRDNTTGLFNRTNFTQATENMRGKRNSKPVVVVYFNDLPTITTIMGALITDKLSESIAHFFQISMRRTLLFRLDRYTFAMIPNNRARAAEILATIQQRFQLPWETEAGKIVLTPTIGYTFLANDPNLKSELAEMMKRCIGSVTESDKIKIVELDQETLDQINRELAVETALREALDNNSLSVYFQPLYEQKTGGFPCAEALARFEHPSMGFISPGEFIPIAEKNGLIGSVGQQIVTKTCQFIAENKLSERAEFRSISVNLSVAELIQENLPESVLEIIRKYEIDPHLIRFEITETAAAITHKTLSRSIDILRQNGLQFLLDDFGSGYANFTSVIELPFRAVKLDRSMLIESFLDERKMIVFDQTVQMIKSLGMEVIIEGAEEAWQAEVLMEKNVDMVQGYYYASPLPADKYLQFLDEHKQV